MPVPIGVEDMVFGERFDDRVQAVVWPGSVVCLDFGVCFEQEIHGVQWPVSLEHLALGTFSTTGWGEARGRALST